MICPVVLQEKFGNDLEIVDRGAEFDDGDYFEVGEDGKMKLKDGQKKIDLSKLSENDLKQLGIDPSTMTKEEISRKLKVADTCHDLIRWLSRCLIFVLVSQSSNL